MLLMGCMVRRTLTSLSFLMVIAGGLLFVETAYAHAAYLRSNPGADAVLTTAPPRVDIWFEQELFRRQGENTITVTAPDGSEVSSGETMVDDDDRTHIWVNLLPGLPAGQYMVAWKNVSLEDGHPSKGSFYFWVDPQSAVTSTPMDSAHPLETMTAPQPPTQGPAPTVAALSSPGGPCAAGLAPLAIVGLLGVTLRLVAKQST